MVGKKSSQVFYLFQPLCLPSEDGDSGLIIQYEMISVKDIYWVVISRLYTIFTKRGFASFGNRSIIRPYPDLIVGKRHISVGYNTIIGKHIQLTAWRKHNGTLFNPTIRIGCNSQFGAYNHITAVNCVEIGNGVLTGKFVTITDNSHGVPSDLNDCDISPIRRTVFSKGPVIIGDNVWIGDKATILANVKIGKGSIIGANAVVTKNVPPYSIVGGNPAKIIKQIK